MSTLVVNISGLGRQPTAPSGRRIATPHGPELAELGWPSQGYRLGNQRATEETQSNVVDLITQDHRHVEELFQKLKAHPEQRAGLVPVLTTLLTAHSRAEEADVYPAAAQAGGEEEVEHSQEGHVEADQMLARLAQTDPGSPEFESVLDELVRAVTHHVEEEESTVLPGMRERLSEDRLDQLGEAFVARRGEHLGEQPEDITKEQLEQQAANMDVSGTSGTSKQELSDELRKSAAD